MTYNDIRNFIYYLNHNKNISIQQKLKIEKLMTRDYDSIINFAKIEQKDTTDSISVSNTVEFLSKFNDPLGLKSLTHCYDTEVEGSPRTLVELREQCRNVMAKYAKKIPYSLRGLMNAYINGDHPWTDTFGNKHNSNIADENWIKWSDENNSHPLNNPEFSKEIMAFRSATRLVSAEPGSYLLQEMVDRLNTPLNIETSKLDKADFYTNTKIFYDVLKRIINQMTRHKKNAPDISISFKRLKDSQKRRLQQIIISQPNSFAVKPIEDLIRRLEKSSNAGDFGSIKNMMNGYCYWSVESVFDGKPLRWNILREEGTEETEEMKIEDTVGFTHTFTFLIV